MDPVAALAPLRWAFGSGGVVAYHDVTAVPFAASMHISVPTLTEQLAFLAAERYHVVPLSEFVARRQAGRSVRRCVALTFDDAYHGVLEYALPLLQRFALPATVFVTTAYAREGPGARYWWDRLQWVLDLAEPGVANQLFSALGVPAGSTEDLRATVTASEAGRLSSGADAAIRAAERQTGVVPERPLSELELRELARSDLIEFGCHTVSHPALPALAPDEQRREISSNHAWLAERLPRVRPFLAYPYGMYDRRTVDVARDVGMEAAFSIEGRAGGQRFELHACPRIGMAEAYSLRSFRMRLSWWTIPLVAWRNGGWHPRVPAQRAAPAR